MECKIFRQKPGAPEHSLPEIDFKIHPVQERYAGAVVSGKQFIAEEYITFTPYHELPSDAVLQVLPKVGSTDKILIVNLKFEIGIGSRQKFDLGFLLTDKASLELFKKGVLILEINYEIDSPAMSVEQKSYRRNLLEILNGFFSKDERKSDLSEFSESMLKEAFENKRASLKKEQKTRQESIDASFLPDSCKSSKQKRRKSARN